MTLSQILALFVKANIWESRGNNKEHWKIHQKEFHNLRPKNPNLRWKNKKNLLFVHHPRFTYKLPSYERNICFKSANSGAVQKQCHTIVGRGWTLLKPMNNKQQNDYEEVMDLSWAKSAWTPLPGRCDPWTTSPPPSTPRGWPCCLYGTRWESPETTCTHALCMKCSSADYVRCFPSLRATWKNKVTPSDRQVRRAQHQQRHYQQQK